MIDPRDPTDEVWWAMCSAELDHPVPLCKMNISKPFVYDRMWGVFHVPFASHQLAMSQLLAFHHGFLKLGEVLEHLNLQCLAAAADSFLERPGTAFRSSVSNKVLAGRKGNLNEVELDTFGHVMYLL